MSTELELDPAEKELMKELQRIARRKKVTVEGLERAGFIITTILESVDSGSDGEDAEDLDEEMEAEDVREDEPKKVLQVDIEKEKVLCAERMMALLKEQGLGADAPLLTLKQVMAVALMKTPLQRVPSPLESPLCNSFDDCFYAEEPEMLWQHKYSMQCPITQGYICDACAERDIETGSYDAELEVKKGFACTFLSSYGEKRVRKWLRALE